MSIPRHPERRQKERVERPGAEDTAMAKGTISHIEFPADDVERAKKFYAAIAGWDFSEMEGMEGYWLFRTAPEAGGAVGRRGDTVGSVVRVYIDVDDLEGAVAAASANGGSVITPPSDIPGQGRYAAVRDPEGNEVGLYQDTRS
jgi:predicted enzyme related to lactoylglutathione lyase